MLPDNRLSTLFSRAFMNQTLASRTTVILLNWNGWPDTLRCLDSLRCGNPVPGTIIVVDNGSTDDSVSRLLVWAAEWTRPLVLEAGREASVPLPPFVLIRAPRNLGFAGGNNLGLAPALADPACGFIWLLNNDTRVRPDTLAALLACAGKPGRDILGATVVFMDNPQRIQCAGGCRYNPWTTVYTPHGGGMPLEQVGRLPESSLDYVFGASMMIRCEVVRRCGVLNEEYFLFYEEIDFCNRARRKGFTLHWCRDAVVEHKGSASLGRPEGGERHRIAFANYHETLSTLLFTRKFYPLRLPWVLVFRVLGKTVAVLGRRQAYLLVPLLAACVDFFSGRRRTLDEFTSPAS